jgi:hypothetical protein
MKNYRLLADLWTFFDNSGETPEIVASEAEHKLSIISADKFRDLVARYGGK